MPVAMPNRVADPVRLEQFVNPGIIRHMFGALVPYYNTSTTLAILEGEPVIFGGRVLLAQRTILPEETGILVDNWIADFLLNPAHTGNLSQGATIYWDLDIDSVTPIDGGAAVSGIGSADDAVPTEGFILGNAVAAQKAESAIVASTGSVYVRVCSLVGATTEYSA